MGSPFLPKRMFKYDYIIKGAGCAGLSLAYFLNDAGILKDKTLAIIENRTSYERDKTWSFWKLNDHDFEDCVIKTWNHFEILNEKKNINVECGNFPYQTVDSKLYYNKILTEIKKNSNIEFHTSDKLVNLNHGIFFNSAHKKNNTSTNKNNSNFYWQHFYGLEFSIDQNIFNEDKFCLMDFNKTQDGNIHFFYILPFSNNKALVESTWISKETNFDYKKCRNEVEDYIKNKLKIDDYDISFEESGSIPLFHNKIKTQNNEILIGSLGNMTRRSTGYTFLNIQKHSKYIIKNIKDILITPKYKIKTKYQILDNILFKVIDLFPNRMPEIFTNLFMRNSNSVIKFLSNESHYLDDLKVINNMPKKLFLKALFK